VLEAAGRLQKACGTQLIEPTAEAVAAALDEGYTFIVLASDVFLLWKWSERMRALVGSFSRRVPHEAGGSRARHR
jgi:2-dehydro-3-deoxyglucarate aldolase